MCYSMKTCCGCCSLKTGCIFISIYYMISATLWCISFLWMKGSMFSKQDLDIINKAIGNVEAFTYMSVGIALFVVFAAIILMFGALSELWCWLVIWLVIGTCATLAMISCKIVQVNAVFWILKNTNAYWGKVIFPVFLLILEFCVSAYSILVVYSLKQELRHPSPQTYPTSSNPLVYMAPTPPPPTYPPPTYYVPPPVTSYPDQHFQYQPPPPPPPPPIGFKV